ncbi:hypothetical protein G9A89_020567 [Geosiphon pyriformis]|nr:hypothetical protein G9A89_020567 [Geosiphon pyriformis]
MDWKTFQQWKKLDLRGLVPYWFTLTANFMDKYAFTKVMVTKTHGLLALNILDSETYTGVHSSLLEIWLNCIKVYTNGSLKGTGSAEMTNNIAVYFLTIDIGIGIRVFELLFFTLAELQAIALVLECVSFSCFVILYSDSQPTIDAYVLET